MTRHICTVPVRLFCLILGGFQALDAPGRVHQQQDGLESSWPTRNCPAMEFFTSHTGHPPAFPWPKSSSSGGFFPPFPHLLSEPWVWIQAGILQDAPEGRWKDFPALINPRGSRTGWFQAQPKVPSPIPCVHQEGLIHGLICDPCDCPQKTQGQLCHCPQ